MFTLSDTPRKTQEILDEFRDPSVGGIVVFEGRVRNHNEGFEVKSLEYEVYPEMALSIGKEIVQEAIDEFNLKFAKCTHFYGHLNIGDCAVIVITGSQHRKEAFLACEKIIDRIKSTVPIWKKEHYVDQTSQWVACHRCSEHRHS